MDNQNNQQLPSQGLKPKNNSLISVLCFLDAFFVFIFGFGSLFLLGVATGGVSGSRNVPAGVFEMGSIAIIVLSVLFFVAGKGLLKNREWARWIAIVASLCIMAVFSSIILTGFGLIVFIVNIIIVWNSFFRSKVGGRINILLLKSKVGQFLLKKR